MEKSGSISLEIKSKHARLHANTERQTETHMQARMASVSARQSHLSETYLKPRSQYFMFYKL